MVIEEFRAEITQRTQQLSQSVRDHILSNRSGRDRMNRSAAIRRAALVEALGGCCETCGTDLRLEFDHKDPATRTWVARDLNQYSRLVRYEQDAANGLIQLLCRRHNSLKGRKVEANPEHPF